MPELPEVETIKRTLKIVLANLTITDVTIFKPKLVNRPDFKEALVGCQISDQLTRRGKYLLLPLNKCASKSGDMTLAIHLRMTGCLVVIKENDQLPKYTHVLFYFDNPKIKLVFADMRQFGRLSLLTNAELQDLSGLKDLGPEPLEKNFNPTYLKNNLSSRRAKIKSLLLNQTLVAGLGNIYVDEALYLAQIHPERLGCDLTAPEVNNLYHAIITVLEQGIQNGGTSISDYVDAEGNAGNNQNMLQAYQRQNKPCYRCDEIITRIKVAGRSSHFCPRCQKIKNS